jgi:hypothetical protein
MEIDVHALYVIGFPEETPAAIDGTFKFARRALWRYGAIPHLGMARPLPGTELYEICERNGYLTEPVLPDMGSTLRGEIFPRIMIRTEHFGPRDLERRIRRFNRQVVTMLAVKSLIWLLRHPRVIPAVWRKFRYDRRRGLSEALKRVFYGGLFFKSNYLREDLRSEYRHLASRTSEEVGS